MTITKTQNGNQMKIVEKLLDKTSQEGREDEQEILYEHEMAQANGEYEAERQAMEMGEMQEMEQANAQAEYYEEGPQGEY